MDIAFNPIRRTRVRVGKHPPISQIRLIASPENRVSVHRRRTSRVPRAIPVNKVRVRDIKCSLIRRKAQPVRSPEPIGHDTDIARRGIEPIYMLRELWFGPKPLFIAVNGIGEPDRAVRMDDDVVGGVEGPAVVVVEQGGGFVRAFGFHVDEAARFAEGALRAEDEAVAVVRAAVSHVVALRAADFVAGEVCWGEEFDFGHDDGFVLRGDGVGGWVGDLVGGDEEGVCGGVKDAGFVEVGGSGVGDQDGEGGGGAEQVEEGVVVDEEGTRLR